MLMTDKIDEAFKTIKVFDIFAKTTYAYSHDSPENLVSNASNFQYYFNASNKAKRLFLDSNQIWSVEKSLSGLLDRLITFHNKFAMKGKNPSPESMANLQQSLRNNIQELLLLGVNTNCDFSMDDKIILVNNKNNEHNDINALIKEVHSPCNSLLFEVYSKEHEAVQNFKEFKQSVSKILRLSMEESEKISNNLLTNNMKRLSSYMSSIETSYQDLELISKLKDIELTFRRKISQSMFENIETLKDFVNVKKTSIDELLNTVDTNVKGLILLNENVWKYARNPRKNSEFAINFEAICKKLVTTVNRITNKQVDTNNSTLLDIETLFTNQVTILKDKISDMDNVMKDVHIETKTNDHC